MEQGLLPPEPAVAVTATSEAIDGRGWLTVMVVMVVIGLGSLRSAPAPAEPVRIPCRESAAWMADALPGIGIKTRDLNWQKIRSGEITALPERARAIARQVFIWPTAPRPAVRTSDSEPHPHP
jgi:hypothetical protein